MIFTQDLSIWLKRFASYEKELDIKQKSDCVYTRVPGFMNVSGFITFRIFGFVAFTLQGNSDS